MNIKIPDFSQARIIVIGDVMLDRYWFGDTSRISPEAPVPIVKMQETEEKPGGAGNVALNLAALGCQTELFAISGDDAPANTLCKILTEAGISCYFAREPNIPTITKLRVMSQHQQLMRLDFEKELPPNIDQKLIAKFKSSVTNHHAVILSDYGKGTLQSANKYIALAKEHNIPVFVDPKNNDFTIYHGATVVTPNFKEFQTVVGKCNNEQHIVEKAQALLKAHEISALLITRGENGMTLCCRDEPAINFPTKAQDVFDVTGAGDTAIATLAATVASGATLTEAVELANITAGITVSKLGAAAINSQELHLATQTNYSSGVIQDQQLKNLMRQEHQKNKKFVMTNGCFDILHIGHIHYLEQAKQLGDYLIVAVNDDDSVKRLKGNNRPINNLENRMSVLAGLQAVDWVIPFSEDTPELLIGELLPDILVKGGDWKPEQIAGSDYVLQNGGEVKILDFLEGNSTTSTIDKIQDLEKKV